MTNISSLLETWSNALLTKDPQKVLLLYDSKAILLPTLSNKVCTSHDDMRLYFDEFLAKGPACTILENHVQFYGDMAINAGLYRFSFTDKSEATARYNFIYRRHNTDSIWRIVSHHSSLLPS